MLVCNHSGWEIRNWLETMNDDASLHKIRASGLECARLAAALNHMLRDFQRSV
jgi:hypothetical protein